MKKIVNSILQTVAIAAFACALLVGVLTMKKYGITTMLSQLKLGLRNFLYLFYMAVREQGSQRVVRFSVCIGVWFACENSLNCIESLKRKQWIQIVLLASLIVISCVYVYFIFITGNAFFMYEDIGADTVNQYYPLYVNFVRTIKDGSFSSWMWNMGIGTSLMDRIGMILDPFGLLTVLVGLVGGTDAMAAALVYIHILKVTLAGICCRYFIKLHGASDRASMIGGYVYAFSGFIMLWGQHYMFGVACLYSVLLLIAVERLVQKDCNRNRIMLSAVVALTMIYSYYLSYMMLVIALIYGAFRVSSFMSSDSVQSRWRRIGCAVGYALIGVGISAVYLIPGVIYLTGSSTRIAGGSSVLKSLLSYFVQCRSMKDSWILLGRIISNNTYSMVDYEVSGFGNYYEAPNLSVGILGSFLVCAYVIRRLMKKEKLGDKIRFVGALIVGLLFLLNVGMATLMNGLQYPSYRYTFTLIPIATLMIALEWDEITETSHRSIKKLVPELVGFAMTIVVLLMAYRYGGGGQNGYVGCLVVMTVLCGACLALSMNRKCSAFFASAAVVIALCNLAVDNSMTNCERDLVLREEMYDTMPNTVSALEFIQEKDYAVYRIDKLYYDVTPRSDSLIEGYSAVTQYNSTMNKNLKNMINHLYPGIKKSEATTRLESVSENDLYALRLFHVKYILSHDDFSLTGLEYVAEIDGVHIYRNTLAESLGYYYTDYVYERDCEQYDLEKLREITYDTVILSDDSEVSELSATEYNAGDFHVQRNVIEGTISTDGTGILVLSIPAQQGWHVYVDGVEQNTFVADYGLIGIEIGAGAHTIVARYDIPGFGIGVTVSIMSLCALIGVSIYCKHRKRRYTESYEG